ncbi:hypothetical protein B0H11DRAFT_2263724 [Mycena galericulata]|nr:hypothetical protein B0H11DRAFT_2263724 [Mycena galericulata]
MRSLDNESFTLLAVPHNAAPPYSDPRSATDARPTLSGTYPLTRRALIDVAPPLLPPPSTSGPALFFLPCLRPGLTTPAVPVLGLKTARTSLDARWIYDAHVPHLALRSPEPCFMFGCRALSPDQYAQPPACPISTHTPASPSPPLSFFALPARTHPSASLPPSAPGLYLALPARIPPHPACAPSLRPPLLALRARTLPAQRPRLQIPVPCSFH